MQLAPAVQDADLSQYKGHPVQLEVFEGPLDLLLHLIKKDKIEIWEISISRITRQYLLYLSTMQSLNIEVAGEFLVMAATLMRIKSQNLLPRPSFLTEEDGEGEPLTREQLIARLVEYRRFREAAREMARMEERQVRRHTRGATETLDSGHMFPLKEPRLVDLAEYLQELLTRRKTEIRTHQVLLEEVKLEEQMEWLESWLAAWERWEPVPETDLVGFPFRRCLRRPGMRLEVVVTFLAMLELARMQRLRIWQRRALDEIWLTTRTPSANGTDPAGAPAGPADDEAPENGFDEEMR